MHCTLHWLPPSLNRVLRTHWTYRRDTMMTATGLILEAAGRKLPAEDQPVRVRLELYRCNSIDLDGAQGSCKPVFDALVKLGWARDDSPKWMQQEVRSIIDCRAVPRTEIDVELLPPDEKREGAVLSSGAKRREKERGRAPA